MRAWPRVAVWPRQFLMAWVRVYRLFFSAWLGRGCRFTPSCSTYALEALGRHGAVAGSYLTAARLLRCHPACTGGHDPVPAQPWPWARPTPSSSSASTADARLPTETSS